MSGDGRTVSNGTREDVALGLAERGYKPMDRLVVVDSCSPAVDRGFTS